MNLSPLTASGCVLPHPCMRWMGGPLLPSKKKSTFLHGLIGSQKLKDAGFWHVSSSCLQ